MRAAHRPFEGFEATEPKKLSLKQGKRPERLGVAGDLFFFSTEGHFLSSASVCHFEVSLHFTNESAEFEPWNDAVTDVGELLNTPWLFARCENVWRRFHHFDHICLELKQIDSLQEDVIAFCVLAPIQGKVPLISVGISASRTHEGRNLFGRS